MLCAFAMPSATMMSKLRTDSSCLIVELVAYYVFMFCFVFMCILAQLFLILIKQPHKTAMTDNKESEKVEVDIYRDTLLRYLGKYFVIKKINLHK